jgi:O-antigen/teichoic acid export membrane protein
VLEVKHARAGIALGAAWLSIAPVAPIAATVTILIMAAAAITAFLRADTETDRWLLSAPIAILAGWLSAAAAVSTGVVIAGYGLLSDTASAVAMIAITLTLATWIQRRKPRMPVYGLTVIWALAGITVANAGLNPTIAILAGLGIGLMALTLLSTRTGHGQN